MGTLAELKTRIASELNRSDLTSAIADQIDRSIDRYASNRFWFNEATRTASTTAGSTMATLTTGPRVIDQLLITVGGSKYGLSARSLAEITELLGYQSSQGQPTEYAYSGSTLTFWPTPDAVYTVTATGIFDEPALATDADSNAWTTEAEDLICYDVLERIARVKLRNVALANEARSLRMEAMGLLRAETARRLSVGISASC